MSLVLVPPYKNKASPIVGVPVGDWTIAWTAKSDNYKWATNEAVAYDIALSEIAKAKRAAIAYYDSTTNPITLFEVFSFDIPDYWKANHPFNYNGNDIVVDATEEATGTITRGTLRYGRESFNTRITDSWSAGSRWGRIGITGTKAPFYNGPFTASGDFTSRSDEQYNARLSTPQRRFIILVK